MKKLLILSLFALFLVKLDSSFVVCRSTNGGPQSLTDCSILQTTSDLNSAIKDLGKGNINFPSEQRFNLMNAVDVVVIK